MGTKKYTEKEIYDLEKKAISRHISNRLQMLYQERLMEKYKLQEYLYCPLIKTNCKGVKCVNYIEGGDYILMGYTITPAICELYKRPVKEVEDYNLGRGEPQYKLIGDGEMLDTVREEFNRLGLV